VGGGGETSPAGAPLRRLVSGIARAGVLIGVLVTVPPGCAPEPTIALPTQRDLLSESRNVELVSGFGGRTQLETWCDRRDPARTEIGVILERPAELLWHADAGPGRFVARVARLAKRSGEDAADEPCSLRVSVVGAPGTAVSVVVPPMVTPVGSVGQEGWAGKPRPRPGPRNEGPAADVVLELPEGARTLRIEAKGASADKLVLLSPRLELQPSTADWDALPLAWRDDELLLGRVPPCTADAQTLFAQRRVTESAEPEPIVACPVEAVASFTGLPGRAALALTGLGANASFTVTLHEDSTLAFALALDERLPQGASARVQALLDDEPLGEWEVFRRTWTGIELPLGLRAGRDRTLELRLLDARLEPEWVATTDIDFIHGTGRPALYRAEQVRVGLADLRLVRPASVRRRDRDDGPNVILVQVETTRADALGPWGGDAPGVTPRLDELAEQSVVWDVAIAPAPWTLPSTATLFTGLPPESHGATDFDRILLPPGVPTMAERARASGVTTGAVMANWLLRESTGFARGFESFAYVPEAGAQQVNALAQSFLTNNADRQFLLVLHYWDPHAEYTAPGAFRDRFVTSDEPVWDADRARLAAVARLAAGEDVSFDDADVQLAWERYLGEIAWFDDRFGALVDMVAELGLERDTVIVFTSDHGEEFAEHGFIGHGQQLFDESVRVPLMVHAPGGQWGPPRRIDGVVGTDGLFAAVLDTLDVPYDGSSVRPALDRDGGTGFAFTQNDKSVAEGWTEEMKRESVAGVRTDEHLLVRRALRDEPDSEPTWSFFDVADDGTTSERPPEGEAFTRLEQLLREARAWSAAHAAARPSAGGDDAQLEVLRAIGYLGDEEDG
jgi:arylsulfatase A-like enzyme